jgi:hypothetical protein
LLGSSPSAESAFLTPVTMENTSVRSYSGAQQAKRKAKPPALKTARLKRKELVISERKMGDIVPDIRDVTLDEFMAAR